MRAGDQKLRYDLEWPNIAIVTYRLIEKQRSHRPLSVEASYYTAYT